MNFQIDSVIEYRTISDSRRTVVVTHTGDRKDGYEVFSGRIVSSTSPHDAVGDNVWGYVDDVVRVVSF